MDCGPAANIKPSPSQKEKGHRDWEGWWPKESGGNLRPVDQRRADTKQLDRNRGIDLDQRGGAEPWVDTKPPSGLRGNESVW